MAALPTKDENPTGLHQRYKVERLNGPTDPNAVYFVLRIDCNGKDGAHIHACRLAAQAWAMAVAKDPTASHLHQTASDLLAYLADSVPF